MLLNTHIFDICCILCMYFYVHFSVIYLSHAIDTGVILELCYCAFTYLLLLVDHGSVGLLSCRVDPHFCILLSLFELYFFLLGLNVCFVSQIFPFLASKWSSFSSVFSLGLSYQVFNSLRAPTSGPPGRIVQSLLF